MIAVDTNILVYAFRPEYELHERARVALTTLLQGNQRCGVPWPCIHEFLAIVTNARIHQNPDPVESALGFVQSLDAAPRCEFLSEGDNHLALLRDLAVKARARGGIIHDARIAAICLAHGVAELWTADRDFLRFPQLTTRNPLIPV